MIKLHQIISGLLITIFALQCTSTKQVEKFQLLWETDGFETPESIIYDTENDVFYVSNIGGKKADEKDGNGFISIMNTDGNIKTLKYVEGLNAPKGMALHNGNLYVSDIDRIVKIDLSKGKIVHEIPVKGAIFLNDITVLDDTLFISDSRTNNYLKFTDSSYTVLTFDTSFVNVNGIITVNDKIISGSGKELIEIDPVTGKWKTFIKETGGIDGLAKVKDDIYIISDWPGKVHLIFTDKEKELLLDTSVDGSNTADFYFDKKNMQVLIPTFFKNSIACYKLNI
jgi:DNA-binding beta-propeller fold protein YncE